MSLEPRSRTSLHEGSNHQSIQNLDVKTARREISIPTVNRVGTSSSGSSKDQTIPAISISPDERTESPYFLRQRSRSPSIPRQQLAPPHSERLRRIKSTSPTSLPWRDYKGERRAVNPVTTDILLVRSHFYVILHALTMPQNHAEHSNKRKPRPTKAEALVQNMHGGGYPFSNPRPRISVETAVVPDEVDIFKEAQQQHGHPTPFASALSPGYAGFPSQFPQGTFGEYYDISEFDPGQYGALQLIDTSSNQSFLTSGSSTLTAHDVQRLGSASRYERLGSRSEAWLETSNPTLTNSQPQKKSTPHWGKLSGLDEWLTEFGMEYMPSTADGPPQRLGGMRHGSRMDCHASPPSTPLSFHAKSLN